MHDRGIVIPTPRKYERLTLQNVERIRGLGCDIPIEIWEAGREVSDGARTKLAQIDGVVFRNVEDLVDDANAWRGFHLKAFALRHSGSEETMLCDADIMLHQSPDALFDDDDDVRTGAYFFKDLDSWLFSKLTNRWVQLRQRIRRNKFTSAAFFLQRRDWLRGLLPERPAGFPPEWGYIYEEDLPIDPVKEALQESGVLVMDRRRQAESIDRVFELNVDRAETYRHVWGDKETYWIGCLLAGRPFHFNEPSGYMHPTTGLLTQDYRGAPYYTQKGDAPTCETAPDPMHGVRPSSRG